MSDINQLIVKNQEESEAEIRQQWEKQDRNRRTKPLSENWPNRAIYEKQLERIRNVNSSQGFCLITIKIIFCSLLGFAPYRRSKPSTFTPETPSVLPEIKDMKLD